jgi:hypothetical protein
MTKKHFIAFAHAIATMPYAYDDATTRENKRIAAMVVVRVAETFNPRFDRTRFLAACGLGD